MLQKIALVFLCSLITISCSKGGPVLHDADGHPVQAVKLKDKWLIVNYWAAWCGSCIKEIPELNRFYQDNQDKNILIYGVNYDQLPMASLKEAILQTNIQFPVLSDDPNQLWQLGEVSVLPMTFIINPQGEVVKKIVGPSTEEALASIVHNLQISSA